MQEKRRQLVSRQHFVLGCVQGPEQQNLRQLTPTSGGMRMAGDGQQLSAVCGQLGTEQGEVEEHFAPSTSIPGCVSALLNALMWLPGTVTQAVMKQTVVTASHFPASLLNLT